VWLSRSSILAASIVYLKNGIADIVGNMYNVDIPVKRATQTQ